MIMIMGWLLRLSCWRTGSCGIVRQIVTFFEEATDESIVDASKLYEGCSIQTLKY